MIICPYLTTSGKIAKNFLCIKFTFDIRLKAEHYRHSEDAVLRPRLGIKSFFNEYLRRVATHFAKVK